MDSGAVLLIGSENLLIGFSAKDPFLMTGAFAMSFSLVFVVSNTLGLRWFISDWIANPAIRSVQRILDFIYFIWLVR